jgi:hypothetical protein
MSRTGITLLTDTGVHNIAGDYAGDDLWLDEEDLHEATGFELKPQGLCRDELCFPIPGGRESEFTRDGAVNVAAFWRYRDGIVVHSEARDVWLLAEPAAERGARLQSLEAPDFTLPDSAGVMHSLSAYRGWKVLLFAWASW